MNKGLIKIQNRHKDNYNAYLENPKLCLECNAPIFPINGVLSSIKHKKYCNSSCAATFNNKIPKRKKKEKIVKIKEEIVLNYTKGELIKKYNNWWSGRVPIAKSARKIFNNSDKPKCCSVCGYSKHYEVCHIKPVSSFDNISTLKEINSIDNLVGLCRNCHWEYDNGLLIL